MPFTFSHPAAVLPLTLLPKQWVSLTGIVIGSMAPDFEYFIRMRVFSSYSHTLTGVLWFDLPVTLILAFLFHLLVRDKLIENSPFFLKKRLYVFKQFQWIKYFRRNFIIVLISSLAGIASHILWDDFTHQYGHFVEAFTVLRQTLSIAGHEIPFFKILQHTSSLLGGLLILYALLRFPSDKSLTNKRTSSIYWLSVGLVTFTVVALRLLTGLEYTCIGNLVVTTITGGLIGLMLTPTLLIAR